MDTPPKKKNQGLHHHSVHSELLLVEVLYWCKIADILTDSQAPTTQGIMQAPDAGVDLPDLN
jgi:hypothetical protein